MFMNDMHQRSPLLSFEISWLIGFCNQWALLYSSVIFQYFSEWGFNMWFKIYWNTFFEKCSCVVLVCLIPTPKLFAMKQKKVRFFVYLGNRQIIGAVFSCHVFELNSPNMLYWKCCVLLLKYIVWDKKCCFQFKFHHKLFFRFEMSLSALAPAKNRVQSALANKCLGLISDIKMRIFITSANVSQNHNGFKDLQIPIYSLIHRHLRN